MARDLNIINIVGRLTKDPEIKTTQNGIKMAKFTIANSDDYKTSDGTKVDRTNFIMCEAFAGTAEIFERYAQKGKQVLLTGKMYVRQGEVEGKRTWYTGITVESVQLLGSAGDSAPKTEKIDHANQQANNPPVSLREQTDGEIDVEIPF